jgi:hypothetical protein
MDNESETDDVALRQNLDAILERHLPRHISWLSE